MTPEIFDAAVRTTRLRQPATDAARRVLVYGTTVQQAADVAGYTYEWARRAVARVTRAAREVMLCPDSWEVVTVCLPPEDAADVRDLERQRRDTLAQ